MLLHPTRFLNAALRAAARARSGVLDPAARARLKIAARY